MDRVKNLTGRGRLTLILCAVTLAVSAAILALAPEKAYAYGFEQTAATKDSATIAWEDPNANSSYATTTGYTVSWGAESGKLTNSITVPASQRSFTITGLKPGSKYYAKVSYTYTTKYSAEARDSIVGSGDICSRVVTPTGVKQTKWYYYAKSVNFTWNKQTAADKVEYRVYKNGSSKVFAKGSSTYPPENFSVDKVKNNVVYTVQMRVHDKWGWSAWSKKAYLFTQPMVNEKKTKVAGSKLTVAWGKISGATSYSVYVSKKEKKGYKKLATVSAKKNSVTLKKLGKAKFSSKKNYYVYVVANKKVGKTTYTSGRHYSYKVKGGRGQLRWTFD